MNSIERYAAIYVENGRKTKAIFFEDFLEAKEQVYLWYGGELLALIEDAKKENDGSEEEDLYNYITDNYIRGITILMDSSSYEIQKNNDGIMTRLIATKV